jgi:hypothetical protein
MRSLMRIPKQIPSYRFYPRGRRHSKIQVHGASIYYSISGCVSWLLFPESNSNAIFLLERSAEINFRLNAILSQAA